MLLRKYITEIAIPEIKTFEVGQLREAAVVKSHDLLHRLGPGIQYVRSYAATNKTLFVYLADNDDTVRQNVEAQGFLANKIYEVPADALVGTISVVRGTRADGTSIEPRFVFCTSEGSSIPLRGDGPIGAAELLRREKEQLVRIQGKEADGLLAVADLEVIGTLRSHIRPTVGPQAWIALLCRFADTPGPPPESKAWFEDLVSLSHPGLRHFFNDVSYNTLDTIIDVLDWRTLPGARADYPSDEQDLLPACTDAYPEIDFTEYYGVIMIVDQDLNGRVSGLGTGREATIHGDRQFWGLVWLGTSGWRQSWIWAQEMGHTWGLKHTLVKSEPIRRSGWDFMGSVTPPCNDSFQGGCLAQHTTAYHKDQLGWLDGNRSTIIAAGVSEVRIASASNPDDVGFLYVEIKLPGETDRYYAVEARHRSGYDNNMPGTAPNTAIVIHEIDLARNPESYTLDHGAGNTNGPGGAWTVGESLLGDGVQIDVLRASGTGFDVRVTYAPLPPIVHLEYAGCFFGSVRFAPAWSAQPGDVATSFEAEIRYVDSSNWVALSGPTVISANSNQRVYLRVKACNAVGCSDYAVVSAKAQCTEHPL